MPTLPTRSVCLIFFLILCAVLVSPPENVHSLAQLAPVVIQLVSYQTCMLSSTLFHTFSCLNESSRNSWLRFDHFGVLVALFGSLVPFICDTFACHPGWRNLHLTCMGLLFLAIAVLNLFPLVKNGGAGTCCHNVVALNDAEVRINLELFILLGLYAAVPFWHWVWLKGGLEDQEVMVGQELTSRKDFLNILFSLL